MNISFTKKQQEYIAEQIESGDYQNQSEVVRDALRLHRIYRDKVLDELRREIQMAKGSPDSKRTLQQIVDSKR